MTSEATIKHERFMLHDGESDAKTVELHDFMLPLIDQKQIYEWEGSDSGITITIDVQPGDVIQRSDDGWVRVVRSTKITRQSHPSILFARQLIEEDNGGHLIGTVYPGDKINFEELKIPGDRWSRECLQAIELALQWVALVHGDKGIESGLYTFCNGETTETEEFIERHHALCRATLPPADLRMAHEFLNDYFNAWED